MGLSEVPLVRTLMLSRRLLCQARFHRHSLTSESCHIDDEVSTFEFGKHRHQAVMTESASKSLSAGEAGTIRPDMALLHTSLSGHGGGCCFISQSQVPGLSRSESLPATPESMLEHRARSALSAVRLPRPGSL